MFSSSASRSSRYVSEQDEDWIEPKQPPRDWKKVFLVVGLGTLSWVATYVGMLELIQANMGSLDLVTKVVVGFSVAMLMTMIIWLLDQMFAPHPMSVKLAYVAGYIFLTMISVGFGFGFYWKVLESRSEASRSAESAVSQVQTSLLAGSARLDQLQSTLQQLTTISQEKAIIERERGTSCPNSRPGDGPRRRLRDDDAGRFSFASNFVKGRSTKVKSDMRGLDGDLKKITSSDASTFDKVTGTRNKFLQALSRKLELTATSFNAFRTDPQLRQIRSELAERANRSTFPTGRGNATFSCPDGQLQSALLGVVRAIDQLPELGKPEIATVEGAQAVVEAFRRLTATGQGALAFKLPPSADELRALQRKAIRSVSNTGNRQTGDSFSGLSQGGLSQRDYIPLSIAMFVDICLLLVSIGRPMNRLGGLVPKMREAERGPVYQILSKFDEIHRDQKIREKFEVFRHVVFDFNGDYYVAVPLDAPRNRNPEEVKNLQLEAHLLANLFASFEKEKIFSRVYNPLLSRKTIQKKLWRQGSKFAASQAFRTYRFRDGAWSDIILGAVMGAARRARTDRIRHAEEAGPQLDIPVAASADDTEARAREIIAATLGEQTAEVKGQLAEKPFPSGNDTKADAARMASAFGPYTNRVEHGNEDGSAAMSWPYRKPPAAPGEADVDLLPANSNTSPAHSREAAHFERSSDANATGDAAENNVILMPLPSPTAVSDGAIDPHQSHAVQSGEPALYTDALAHAIAMPHQSPAPRAVVEPELAEVGPTIVIEPMPEQKLATSMNVRITQRTADFQIPVSASSNGQPMEFIRAGMNATILPNGSNSVETSHHHNQLALDLPSHDVSSDQSTLSIEADDIEEVNATTSLFALPIVDVDPEIEDLAIISRGGVGAGALDEDELEEISRRFAPKRGGE
ncbi:MAG: hypothetical protein ACI9XZ_003081 [Alphaproteobacteria bacterium]|jgi:hypothetical protein